MIHSLNQRKLTNRDTSHSMRSGIKRLSFVIYEQLFCLVAEQTVRAFVLLTVYSLSPPRRFVRSSVPHWPACRLHTA
jgi:hypothetical protein